MAKLKALTINAYISKQRVEWHLKRKKNSRIVIAKSDRSLKS